MCKNAHSAPFIYVQANYFFMNGDAHMEKLHRQNHLTPAQMWEQLTFADDFIFYKVLEKNLDFTQELLELLLDIKIDHIEQPIPQKDCKSNYFSKGARFDVYVKDTA